MRGRLPPSVEIVELPDGIRYRLPRRRLGWTRWLGLIPLALGSLGLVMQVWGLAPLLAGDVDMPGIEDIPAILLFLAIFLVWGAVCLSAVGFGLILLTGRSEVELRAGFLHAIERCGPLRWSWRAPAAGLCRFVVAPPAPRPHHFFTMGAFAEHDAIQPEWDGLEPAQYDLLLAPGYPHRLLRSVAEHLAHCCQEAAGGSDAGARPIQVLSDPSDESSPSPRGLARPSGSAVTVERSATGVTLRVPPCGVLRLRGSAGGRLWFGAVAAVMAAASSWAVATGSFEMKGGGDSVLIPALIVAALWMAAAFLILSGVNMGRRKAVLAVVGDELIILQTGLFRTRQWRWRRHEVADVCCGLIEGDNHNGPVTELQVHLRGENSKKVGLLAGRDKIELRWLAAEVRRALHVAVGRGQRGTESTDRMSKRHRDED